MARIAAALQALVSNLIDYAGLYPPAGLPLAIVTERYRAFRASPDAWMLNRLVLPAAQLAEAQMDEGWRITLIVDDEPGELPRQVETLETKLPRALSLPTYCEAPLLLWGGHSVPAQMGRHRVPAPQWAKVRTGGLTPDAIPTPARLAEFLVEVAQRRIPFKATAGLHHPVRSVHRLTYSPDSPSAEMHGFLNVFLAACFAWHGMKDDELTMLLQEMDPRAFEFDDAAQWCGHSLSTEQIATARREFAHSFGSCSFEEPVCDLRELGWMP